MKGNGAQRMYLTTFGRTIWGSPTILEALLGADAARILDEGFDRVYGLDSAEGRAVAQGYGINDISQNRTAAIRAEAEKMWRWAQQPTGRDMEFWLEAERRVDIIIRAFEE